MKRWLAPLSSLFAIGLLVALFACMPNQNPNSIVPPDSAGFMMGFWHGCIAWITFVLSLLGANINIYEVHNTGTGYNFGFLIGITLGITGLITLLGKIFSD